jgi:hypothetical protein
MTSKRLASAAAALAILSSIPSQAANITYDVNLSSPSFASAMGFIITDGTLGQLTAADILDWNLLLQIESVSPVLSFDLLGPVAGANQNSGVNLVGTPPTATSDSLFFDFGAGNSSELIFHNPASAGGSDNSLCFLNLVKTGLSLRTKRREDITQIDRILGVSVEVGTRR